MRRAEKAGFKAIALTVDTPRLGRREADIKNRYPPLIFSIDQSNTQATSGTSNIYGAVNNMDRQCGEHDNDTLKQHKAHLSGFILSNLLVAADLFCHQI